MRLFFSVMLTVLGKCYYTFPDGVVSCTLFSLHVRLDSMCRL